MAGWKVGDKVRILDASKIKAAESAGYQTGGIYKVVAIDEWDGSPHLESLNENPKDVLVFFSSEKPYYEFVNEVNE